MYTYTVSYTHLPEGWITVDSEFVTQIVESVGEEIASANGFDQSLLDQLAAASTSPVSYTHLEAIFPVEKHLTDEAVRAGSDLGIMEMLCFGTTSFNDMYMHMDMRCV